MPAGDLLTANYQAELQGLLIGVGTQFEIIPPGISGLGVPPPKTADVPLDEAPGSYGSPDQPDKRVITIPFAIKGADDGDAMDLFDDAIAAWTPTAADVELHLQLPGSSWGHVVYEGRPRGLVEVAEHLHTGTIYCFGTFEALDPTRSIAGS